MQFPIELRLKIRHWFKKYGKILFILFLIWTGIVVINKFLGDYTIEEPPQTTYKPEVSVVNPNVSVPKKVQATAESAINDYVTYCNDGNYQKAFNLLSEECRKYEFENSVEKFAKHVLTKMPVPKKHSIQNYSNYGDYYIYEIKYIDDILATGLTNQVYNFTTEKITLKKTKDGEYELAVGNFIGYEEIKNVAENDYLKVNVESKLINYSMETYVVKFTNRTDNIIVISDNYENNEINLELNNEYRGRENINETIVLDPEESKTVKLEFTKFADDGDISRNIFLANVRVMEKYTKGVVEDNIRKAEIDNAIAKFSMSIPLETK